MIGNPGFWRVDGLCVVMLGGSILGFAAHLWIVLGTVRGVLRAQWLHYGVMGLGSLVYVVSGERV